MSLRTLEPPDVTYSSPSGEERYGEEFDMIDALVPIPRLRLAADFSWSIGPSYVLYPGWPQEIPGWATKLDRQYYPQIGQESIAAVNALLAAEAQHKTVAEDLAEIASSTGFDAPWKGVVVNFESWNYPALSDQMNNLLGEFAVALHAVGLELCVAMHYDLDWDVGAVSGLADKVHLLCYIFNLGLSPLSPAWYTEQQIEAAIAQGLDVDKTILVFPSYSRYIDADGVKNDITAADARTIGATLGDPEFIKNLAGFGDVYEVLYGDATERVWLQDRRAMWKRIQICEEYGCAGLGVYILSFGDDDFWKVVRSWKNSSEPNIPDASGFLPDWEM